MSAAATTSAITLTSAIGLGIGGALVAILLVLFLSGKEIIGSSSKSSKKLTGALDAAIIPLFIAFCMTVAFQVAAAIA